MTIDPRTNRLGWFIPLRLASYIILFTVVVAWMGYPALLRSQFVIYSVLTLSFTVLLYLGRRMKLSHITSVVIALQFLAEIILESGIIYGTGNGSSPFSALFILTIVSAALTYGLVGTLLVASFASAAHAFILWFGLADDSVPRLFLNSIEAVFKGQDTVFYTIFLHMLIYYLVAFISGYLAEKLRTQERSLERASQDLRKARLETDDILRHLNSGLITVDLNGQIVYFNRAAERILDYREEDVKGMLCEEVFAERMPSLARGLMDGIEEKVQLPRQEIEFKTRDGLKVPLGLSTSILMEDNQSPRGVIAIFSDLTEAKALEAKVRVSDRLSAVGELSASIAHEIRNPLASISGSVEVLKNELQVEGENKRLMDLIVKESHRLSRILSDFLLYARIERPTYNKVDLCHLIAEVVEIMVHHDSYTDTMDIVFETDEPIIYVVGDEDLLKQLLLNLVVNACEAIDTDCGEITLRSVVNLNTGLAELFIEDHGPGIPRENLKKIYQPFFSTKKQGTGLGLSIVHRIGTALNAKISVDSQLGEGTTFLVEIPLFKGHKRGNNSQVLGSIPEATSST